MHAIRRLDERPVGKVAPGRSRSVDKGGGTEQSPRRIAEPPGAAVVLAPVLGLVLWGGLIALLVI